MNQKPVEMVNICKAYKPVNVTLVDGRVVLSDSLEWRLECECRYYLGVPPEQREHRFLLTYKIRRPEGLEALRERLAAYEPYFVLALPDKQSRNAYANSVGAAYGGQARYQLMDRVRELWNIGRQAVVV